jgi:hypothetical protein
VILPTLALLVLVSVLVVRAVGGVHPVGRAERIYVALSPLPWVMSLVIPAAIGLIGGFSGLVAQTWIRRSSWIGVGVSVVFGVVGAALVGRLVARRSPWGWPLGASVLLAASPFLLVAVSSGLLWLMGRIR